MFSSFFEPSEISKNLKKKNIFFSSQIEETS